jgi:hypothetical protein
MKRLIIIIYFLISKIVGGQNLVLNPNFEGTLTCLQLQNLGGLSHLKSVFWYRAIGTPDLFTCNSTCGSAPNPQNGAGYQIPHSGCNYCGLAASSFAAAPEYREMLGGKLAGSLIQGHNYYVSAGDRCQYVTDDIGFYFSNDSINPDSDFVFQYTPQVENPDGNMLSDTLNWMLISGYFIAQGGEQWIIIGNFKDDAHTTLDTLANWIVPGSYYFVDDVSVIDCTATGINEQQQIAFTLLQNPVTNSVGFTSPQQIQTATVFTTMGAMVKQVHFSNTINYSFDVADLPRGLYFLQVATKDKRKGIRKFLKQ